MPAGQSIQYIAEERASDPKVMGIVANGYDFTGVDDDLGMVEKPLSSVLGEDEPGDG